MPRSTYPILCVKRTGKQNLRLFRGNKNGRTRETRRNRVSHPVRAQFRRAYLLAHSERDDNDGQGCASGLPKIFSSRVIAIVIILRVAPFVSSALPSLTHYLWEIDGGYLRKIDNRSVTVLAMNILHIEHGHFSLDGCRNETHSFRFSGRIVYFLPYIISRWKVKVNVENSLLSRAIDSRLN